MRCQGLGLPLMELLRMREQLRRLSAAAAASQRHDLARRCDAAAEVIGQWLDDVLP